MITNLFSIFDPFGVTNNLLLGVLMLVIRYSLSPIVVSSALARVSHYVSHSLKIELDVYLVKGATSCGTWLFISLFLSIARANALGLVPYIFTVTSFIALPSILALGLWLRPVLFRMYYHRKL